MSLENLQPGLERYRDHGIKPGGFLSAVLENDLYMALARADDWNRDNLGQIVKWVHWSLPAHIWGSREAVQRHVNWGREHLQKDLREDTP